MIFFFEKLVRENFRNGIMRTASFKITVNDFLKEAYTYVS